MLEDLVTALTFMAFNLLWLVPVLAGLYWISQPARRRKLALQRRALDDYKSARGTDQKILLGKALGPAKASLRELNQKIDSLEDEASSAKQQCVEDYLAHLEAKIVEEEFGKLPGVGPKLRQNILGEVFHGRLNDLRNASRVRGVGASRQQVINDWIAQCRARISGGSYTDAEAKARFKHMYREQVAALGAQRAQLEAQHKALSGAIQQAEHAFRRFEAVRLDHFQKALTTSKPAALVPDWYFQGVYAAWEPVPDWFRAVTTQPEQGRP